MKKIDDIKTVLTECCFLFEINYYLFFIYGQMSSSFSAGDITIARYLITSQKRSHS